MASSSTFQQCSVALACILLSLFTSSAQFPPGLPPNPVQPAKPAGGFHFKLDEDIQVNASRNAVLKPFSITDLGNNEELFSETDSGLDNFAGIFRPGNGYYFLSTLVHVAVVTQEEFQSQAKNSTSIEEGEKEPRATVSVCINENCGNSAILKSSSVLPSSGETHTFSISGILNLQKSQKVTVQVQNHSRRQVLISNQSTFNTFRMKPQYD